MGMFPKKGPNGLALFLQLPDQLHIGICEELQIALLQLFFDGAERLAEQFALLILHDLHHLETLVDLKNFVVKQVLVSRLFGPVLFDLFLLR